MNTTSKGKRIITIEPFLEAFLCRKPYVVIGNTYNPDRLYDSTVYSFYFYLSLCAQSESIINSGVHKPCRFINGTEHTEVVHVEADECSLGETNNLMRLVEMYAHRCWSLYKVREIHVYDGKLVDVTKVQFPFGRERSRTISDCHSFGEEKFVQVCDLFCNVGFEVVPHRFEF